MESKKRVRMNFSTKQKQSYRWRKHIYSYQGVRQERDRLEDCGWHIRTTTYTADNIRTCGIAHRTLLHTNGLYGQRT